VQRRPARLSSPVTGHQPPARKARNQGRHRSLLAARDPDACAGEWVRRSRPDWRSRRAADQEGWAAAELASVQISIDQVIQVRQAYAWTTTHRPRRRRRFYRRGPAAAAAAPSMMEPGVIPRRPRRRMHATAAGRQAGRQPASIQPTGRPSWSR
jgi:hypothetical protein